VGEKPPLFLLKKEAQEIEEKKRRKKIKNCSLNSKLKPASLVFFILGTSNIF
jgi:hypothetical protein